MLATLLLPDSNVLKLDELLIEEHAFVAVVTTCQPGAECPVCGHLSHSVHSHYNRTVTDLPCASIPVQLRLQVRKFFCRNAQCERTIFTERLPAVVAPWARRSLRLTAQQRQLGLDFGGEAGARAGNRLGLLASSDTVLRMVRRGTVPTRPTPRVLGVDDWAKRKGQTYGTILVDLETHEPADLLPDRTADTLAEWLQEHPGVEIISRDRSGAYADGARRGSPEAVQVADRFHLLGNLREALEAVVSRHKIVLLTPPSSTAAVDRVSSAQTTSQKNADCPVSDDVVERVETHEGVVASLSLSPAMKRYEPTRTANRVRRKARYDQVVALHQQGLSQKAIALRVNLSTKTIRRWLRSGSFPECTPHRKRKTLLSPFEPYLHDRWSEGCHNGTQLWRELCEQGYVGSRTTVAQWVARRRQGDDSLTTYPSVDSPPPMPQPPVSEQIHSPRQISFLLIRDREKLIDEAKAFLDQLLERNPSVAAAYRFAQDFRHLAQIGKAEAFDTWLDAVNASDLLDLKRFAAGLKRDYPAVFAALSLPWSNGPVEGHVNRLKFIKRQGYGRANFALLRHRVLAA